MDGLKDRDKTGGNGTVGPDGAAGVVAEGRLGRDGVLEGVLTRREQHRKRSAFVRVGVVMAGGAVGLFAFFLSVVVPEIGLPLLLFGLRLLALEFDWAARLYAGVARLARRVVGMFGRLSSRSKAWVVLAVVALVASIVYALLG